MHDRSYAFELGEEETLLMSVIDCWQKLEAKGGSYNVKLKLEKVKKKIK